MRLEWTAQDDDGTHRYRLVVEDGELQLSPEEYERLGQPRVAQAVIEWPPVEHGLRGVCTCPMSVRSAMGGMSAVQRGPHHSVGCSRYREES